MALDVSVLRVQPRRLAAVHRVVTPGGVASAWRHALDEVWAFLRERPALHQGGHNVFLYRHPSAPGELLEVAFGVEVARSFDPAGEVVETSTPGGDAAVAVHRGDYGGLGAAHEAIRAWVTSNGRNAGRWSWEIYGDPADDPGRTETTVAYLLE
ncbi:MAG: GyrI-like domain-containing protein [Dehalococcoidia bacterium]